MTKYTAVDERAEIALDIALEPFLQATLHTTRPVEIVKAMHDTLQPFMAVEAEMLYQRARIMHGKNANALSIVLNVILSHICDALPKLNNECYYTYSDVANYATQVMHVDAEEFEETFRISVGTDTLETALTQDQLLGIVYAKTALQANIKIESSLDGVSDEVSDDDLIQHMWWYTTQPTLATQELERPYRAHIREYTVYFDNLEFLQGVISVCKWLNVDPHTVILDLREFTREGEISMTF